MTVQIRAEYDRLVAANEISADPAQIAVLPLFQPILDWTLTRSAPKKGFFARFAKPEPVPRGLYLWGGVGRGKSMMMDLFHRLAAGPKRRVHFHAFMQEIQSGLHEARKTGVDDALKPVAEKVAAEVRLLCFDEMQITDITDAMIVGRLFQMLMDAGVVIVTTSNRPPSELYKDGLNRALFLPFIALLEERLVVKEIVSQTDYRQERLQGQQTYFYPVDPAAREALDLIWAAQGSGPAQPLVLKIKGRDVVLPEFRSGAARAPFWDLCGQPLGPADYLAIADAVRLLIIDGVPQLSSENFNQAKRFVTLIDALYEAKVRLVVSAADAPEKLYIEGEGSFEFARTASRLREMMSEGWGVDQTP